MVIVAEGWHGSSRPIRPGPGSGSQFQKIPVQKGSKAKPFDGHHPGQIPGNRAVLSTTGGLAATRSPLGCSARELNQYTRVSWPGPCAFWRDRLTSMTVKAVMLINRLTVAEGVRM